MTSEPETHLGRWRFWIVLAVCVFLSFVLLVLATAILGIRLAIFFPLVAPIMFFAAMAVGLVRRDDFPRF